MSTDNSPQQPITEFIDELTEGNSQREGDEIEVQVDMIQRVYGSMFISSQIVQQSHINLGEESAVLLKHNLMEAITTIAVDYPQLADFDVNVAINDDNVPYITGNNVFTQTILHFISQVKFAPISDSAGDQNAG